MPTRERTEETKKRTVVVGRVEWDVLVLADGDSRQPVGGGVHGLPSDVAHEGVRLGVAGDLRIVRSAEPDAWRWFDAVAPLVTRDEERPEERHPVGRVGFLRVRETKLSGIDTPDVRGP